MDQHSVGLILNVILKYIIFIGGTFAFIVMTGYAVMASYWAAEMYTDWDTEGQFFATLFRWGVRWFILLPLALTLIFFFARYPIFFAMGLVLGLAH